MPISASIQTMKEFEGELDKISPGKLIDKEKLKDFDSFFLVLGLIYNDLKDLMLLYDLFIESYPTPKLDGTAPASVSAGQWGGVQNHFNRLMIGFISEFLTFLEKNKDVMSTPSFKFFEKRLQKEVRESWYDILRVINNEKTDDFLSEIARIRSTITFHYDHQLKALRSGFIKKFFTTPKNNYNDKAYYSLGDTMRKTRFYYCDGAAEEYLNEHMKSFSEDNHNKEIRHLVDQTNKTLRFMMENYLNYKINQKN